jgi:hypothetical protein
MDRSHDLLIRTKTKTHITSTKMEKQRLDPYFFGSIVQHTQTHRLHVVLYSDCRIVVGMEVNPCREHGLDLLNPYGEIGVLWPNTLKVPELHPLLRVSRAGLRVKGLLIAIHYGCSRFWDNIVIAELMTELKSEADRDEKNDLKVAVDKLTRPRMIRERLLTELQRVVPSPGDIHRLRVEDALEYQLRDPPPTMILHHLDEFIPKYFISA